MKQVEKKMLDAVRNGRNFRSGNTVVSNENGVICVYLFGNQIAEFRDGKRFFTLAGWCTVTTRSRVNALGANVSQRNFAPYFNGVQISSYNWYEF